MFMGKTMGKPWENHGNIIFLIGGRMINQWICARPGPCSRSSMTLAIYLMRRIDLSSHISPRFTTVRNSWQVEREQWTLESDKNLLAEIESQASATFTCGLAMVELKELKAHLESLMT